MPPVWTWAFPVFYNSFFLLHQNKHIILRKILMQILHLQMQVPQPYANFITFWPSIEAISDVQDLETFCCPKNVTWWKISTTFWVLSVTEVLKWSGSFGNFKFKRNSKCSSLYVHNFTLHKIIINLVLNFHQSAVHQGPTTTPPGMVVAAFFSCSPFPAVVFLFAL